MKKLCFLTLLSVMLFSCQKQWVVPQPPALPSVTPTFSVGTTVLATDSMVKLGASNLEVPYWITNTSKYRIWVKATVVFNFKGGMGLSNLRNCYIKIDHSNNYALPPMTPLAVNPYTPEYALDPGQTGPMYVGFGFNTDSVGSATPSLIVQARIDTTTVTSSPTAGQTFTIKAPPPPLTVPVPTFVSATSSVSQYIAVGTSIGVIDAAKFTFNQMLSTTGTLTKAVFKVSSSNVGVMPVTSIHIGNISAPVVGDSVVLTGLSVALTANGVGNYIGFGETYLPINPITGLVSGTQSIITLVSVTISSGSQTATTTCNVVFPTMTIVGSKPTVSINTTPMTGLVFGTEVKICEITVTADANGSIASVQHKYLISSTGFNASGVTLTNARIANVAGITIPQSNTTVHNTAGAGTDYVTCSLSSSPVIPPGTSKTYYLYAKVSGIPTGASYSLSTMLDPAGYLWIDTAGGSTGVYDGNTPFHNFPTGVSILTQ